MPKTLPDSDSYSIRIPDPDNPGKTRKVQLSRDQIMALGAGSAPAKTRFGLPSSPLTVDVDEGVLVELSRVGRRRSFAAGSTISSEGEIADSVYIVVSGKLLCTSEDRHGKVWRFFDLATAAPGDVVGEDALIGDHRARKISSTEDSTVIQIFREDFLAVLQSSAQLAINLSVYLAERVVRSSQRFSEFAGAFTSDKVAMVLMYEAQADGTPVGSGKVRINSPITHEDLASQVGVTRESVVAAMRKLADVVERNGRYYTVDVGKLKGFIEGTNA